MQKGKKNFCLKDGIYNNKVGGGEKIDSKFWSSVACSIFTIWSCISVKKKKKKNFKSFIATSISQTIYLKNPQIISMIKKKQ